MLYYAINNGTKIIQWQHNYFNSINNLHLREEDLEYIKTVLDMLLIKNQNYCSANLLFNSVIDKMTDIFKINKINSARNLFYIVQYFFAGHYNFRFPHITVIDELDNLNMKVISLLL